MDVVADIDVAGLYIARGTREDGGLCKCLHRSWNLHLGVRIPEFYLYNDYRRWPTIRIGLFAQLLAMMQLGQQDDYTQHDQKKEASRSYDKRTPSSAIRWAAIR